MQVKDIMTKKIEFTSSYESLRSAADTMREKNVGFLPVRDGVQLLGVVTDRDLALRPAERARPYDTATVGDVMTRKAHAIRSDTEIAGVAAAMKEKSVRRLLVLDEKAQLVGVVSLSDIAGRSADVELACAAIRHLSRARAAATVASHA